MRKYAGNCKIMTTHIYIHAPARAHLISYYSKYKKRLNLVEANSNTHSIKFNILGYFRFLIRFLIIIEK